MEEAFSSETLKQQVASSELGEKFLKDPLMEKDVWPVTELGYSEEEVKIKSIRNLYFQNFSLEWLKCLTKLTVQASVRQKQSLGHIAKKVRILKNLDNFLTYQGYYSPIYLNDTCLQEFIKEKNSNNRKSVIAYIAKLWLEEEWIKIQYVHRKTTKDEPIIETIPEEVLFQVFRNFDLFPPPLERLFRLQLALGCRLGESLKMPRRCLKQENDKWFLLRWIAKQKTWQFFQIHRLLAELIREQQKFLDHQFGITSKFDKLFCKVSAANRDGASNGNRFEVNPIYIDEPLSAIVAYLWLQSFSEIINLRDRYGNSFHLTSHKFRRTKLSIMAYCETEDEFIAAVAGHGSLDMLPHYRKRSLDQLEKESQIKGYVDKYGQITTFKPRKPRSEKLATILKVSTPLGECHRATVLGDCPYRYACLECIYHRVTLEDKPRLENDLKELRKDWEKAQQAGKQRRVTEINRLLALVQNRLNGLETLQNLQGDEANG